MTGAAWVASYLLLWVAVVVLSVAVVVLLRQIGVLHARLRPTGVHHANEGPVRDAPAPTMGWFDFGAAARTLLVFTSPTCEICRALVPSLHRLRRHHDDLGLEIVGHAPDTAALFTAYNVTSTPYVVAVDRDGTVRGGGLANSLEQVEVMLASLDATSDDHTGRHLDVG